MPRLRHGAPRQRRVPGPAPACPGPGAVGRALRLAREQLDIEAALLTEVLEGQDVVRHVVQDGAFPGLVPGLSAPLRDTICNRLLEGRVANLVGDVRADPELCQLPLVRAYGVGAYLGVPLTAADARLYLLCCLAREARPGLGDDDVSGLHGLASGCAGRSRGTRRQPPEPAARPAAIRPRDG